MCSCRATAHSEERGASRDRRRRSRGAEALRAPGHAAVPAATGRRSGATRRRSGASRRPISTRTRARAGARRRRGPSSSEILVADSTYRARPPQGAAVRRRASRSAAASCAARTRSGAAVRMALDPRPRQRRCATTTGSRTCDRLPELRGDAGYPLRAQPPAARRRERRAAVRDAFRPPKPRAAVLLARLRYARRRACGPRPAVERKVERPPYEQLMPEIAETSYLAVGRKYGVSDNAIRKWLRAYERARVEPLPRAAEAGDCGDGRRGDAPDDPGAARARDGRGGRVLPRAVRVRGAPRDGGFAVLGRDDAVLHLWEAGDEEWRDA